MQVATPLHFLQVKHGVGVVLALSFTSFWSNINLIAFLSSPSILMSLPKYFRPCWSPVQIHWQTGAYLKVNTSTVGISNLFFRDVKIFQTSDQLDLTPILYLVGPVLISSHCLVFISSSPGSSVRFHPTLLIPMGSPWLNPTPGVAHLLFF